MQKWNSILPETSMSLATTLVQKAQEERQAGKVIYPPQDSIFRALTLTPPECVKIVIVGQDPYHGGGQANGLAFSVNPGVPCPPSLRNIFCELHEDLGVPMPSSGDLTPWAERGVLLLNTVLTVEDGVANSHKNWGWQEFVLEVFRACTNLPQPIVFILWGGQARAFLSSLQVLDHDKKACVVSSHPSPLGARKGSAQAPAFIGSRPFSTANHLLQNMGGSPVDWAL